MLRKVCAHTNKVSGSLRLLPRTLGALAAVAALAGVLTSPAHAAGVELHFEGSCGLLEAWSGDCQHIAPEFSVVVPKSEVRGRRPPRLYVLTRPTRASCLVYTVYAEYQDVRDTWNSRLTIDDVSHAVPRKSHESSTRWDIQSEGRYSVFSLRLRVKFDSFLEVNNWIVPDCKKRGVFPPGNTITNDTQLPYHAEVRVTAVKKEANWTSRGWERRSPPRESGMSQ